MKIIWVHILTYHRTLAFEITKMTLMEAMRRREEMVYLLHA